MNIKEQIKNLIKEAEIYRSQGLFEESKMRYNNIVDLIKHNKKIKNKKSLVNALLIKISKLEDDVNKVEQAQAQKEMTKGEQDLVKNLFAYSSNKNEVNAALEGAVALAKFGQFGRALEEFQLLIKTEAVRVEAAKNIIRCHMTLSSVDMAVSQFKNWMDDDLFSHEQLRKIRFFFKESLAQQGVEIELPKLVEVEESQDEIAEERADEDFIDISSIIITFQHGPCIGRDFELDVSFQTGNIISLIISSRDAELIESLEVGRKLSDVQFFSPIAIFKGSGIVTDKTKIAAGPKRGDFSVDIKIVAT